MPFYMDIHTIEGVTPEALAHAHAADAEAQATHGVNYLKYWINEHRCKACCLVDAPTPEAAMAVHREARGFVAGKIIEVDPDMLEGFMSLPFDDIGDVARKGFDRPHRLHSVRFQ